MSKKIIAILAVVGVIVILFMWGSSWYNGTVTKQEGVGSQWANVESSYQRRNDLIPNIVATAKQYAEFEKETLTGVVEARAKATSIQVDASQLTPETIAQYSQAQSAVSAGLGRLLATYENYPNLKANENFKELINELSRTENRINVERNRYNEVVKAFNLQVKTFPGVLLNAFFGFNESPYFKADEAAATAPKVNDLFNN